MPSRALAAEEFDKARTKGFWNKVASWVTGKSNELLPFEEVRQRLPFEGQHYLGLRTVRLEKIVGSVGRYRDFDRAFLPQQSETQYRWQSIEEARAHGVVLPPVELYKIGDAYFVKDGNHRVSVARTHGQEFIDAHITEIEVPVPVTPETDIDEIIRNQEYAAFLHKTHLNDIRPNVDVKLTLPGQYEKLLEHIAVHRWYLSEERGEEVPNEEAVASWVDNVYLPLVEIIRQEEILDEFPDRTEADLYLWLSEHRAQLARWLGWEVDLRDAAVDLAEQFSSKPGRVASRVRKKILEKMTPKKLEGGAETGEWREQRVEKRGEDRLFVNILVAINGEEGGWHAQEHALRIARRERGYLHGLHVVAKEEERETPEVQALREEFEERCAAAQVPGQLLVEVGPVVGRISERARWTDLVVVSLNYPPGSKPLEKLGSGFRELIHRASRPLLAVPTYTDSAMERALLAYDDTPKANEALFISAHLAGHWEAQLTVVTVMETAGAISRALVHAQRYLKEREIEAKGVEEKGSVGEAILRVAEEERSDLILMGSYGSGPLLEVVLGSAVDQVLREAHQPVLICR